MRPPYPIVDAANRIKIGIKANSYILYVCRSPEKLIASFPTAKLRSLTQKISNPRWVVPVLPEQELEVLLNAAIELAQAGKKSINARVTVHSHHVSPFFLFFRCGS